MSRLGLGLGVNTGGKSVPPIPGPEMISAVWDDTAQCLTVTFSEPVHVGILFNSITGLNAISDVFGFAGPPAPANNDDDEIQFFTQGQYGYAGGGWVLFYQFRGDADGLQIISISTGVELPETTLPITY